MDQLLNLGLYHFPNLEEARKVIERYVPSKLALLHTTVLAAVIGSAEYGYFTALLLLLWILALAIFSAGTTLLKQWPTDSSDPTKPMSATAFIDSVKAGDDTTRFLAVRASVSASAFFGFAYLMQQPFVLLGLYWPIPALMLFAAATSFAAKLGYTDRLREAADADRALKAAAIASSKSSTVQGE